LESRSNLLEAKKQNLDYDIAKLNDRRSQLDSTNDSLKMSNMVYREKLFFDSVQLETTNKAMNEAIQKYNSATLKAVKQLSALNDSIGNDKLIVKKLNQVILDTTKYLINQLDWQRRTLTNCDDIIHFRMQIWQGEVSRWRHKYDSVQSILNGVK
jgi:hypothetical protein